MNLSLYSSRSLGDKPFEPARYRSSWSVALTSSVYAHVLVDIQARELKDKLFTYRVPAALAAETFIGAQVLVPFGARDLVGGYVVSLSDQAGSALNLKEIAEVVEPEPLFDRQYVDFLYWIADYYCAALSDVISAAVPAIFSPRFKRMVKLNKALSTPESLRAISDQPTGAMLSILQASKSGALAVNALKQRWRKATKQTYAQFHRTMNLLRQEGFIAIDQESGPSQAPKTVTTVIWTGQDGQTRRQKEVIQALSRHGGQLTQKELIEQCKTTHATIKKMSEAGLVEIVETECIRDPLKSMADGGQAAPLNLTEDQQAAMVVLSGELSRILEPVAKRPSAVGIERSEIIDRQAPRAKEAAASGEGKGTATVAVEGEHALVPWLLHGVTGSGKTEIYLRLIEQALASKRTALMLVPEISLTPQLARRLKSRFGDLVAVWHSALSDGERYDTWRRMRAGEVKVLLGARSAVLANLPDVGLIILDEEHDGSYKQTSPSPRYNAREVAIERGKRQNAMVLLGSATPDVSVYFAAEHANHLLNLPERALKQAMPAVQIVDMREEFANANKSIFSRLLDDRLRECLERKEQAILLMNRRGYASHVFCRACGHVVKCRNCSVPMVFHQPSAALGSVSKQSDYLRGFLSCHHCGLRGSATEVCPACKSPFIRQFGLGTQRIEEEVRQRFPDTRILRLDSDVTARKGAHDEILQEFAAGRADVLIGTQMVSKGLDIHNVTLVGVLAADAAFNLPDYRAVERGFQLLTQVSGRAGRGDRPGSVVFQSYNVEMPVLQWSKMHDYMSFMREELEARRAFQYPPFSQLIRVVVAGHNPLAVQSACERLAEEIGHYLEERLPLDLVKILGPAPCLLERLRGKYRFHLLIKNMAFEEGRTLITQLLRNKEMPPDLSMAVDVDALDLL
ncbi:MAG TPA: primosomal protein N' [Chroococcales cyanobacterium]